MVNVYIAADHGGWKLRLYLIEELAKQGVQAIDVSPKKFNPDDDYPDVAKKLARVIQNDKKAFGILICGSGVGMCMAANRYKGVRAAHVHDVKLAKFARLHDNANVLCMGERFISKQLAKKVMMRFLHTPFATGERYRRRDRKLARIKD